MYQYNGHLALLFFISSLHQSNPPCSSLLPPVLLFFHIHLYHTIPFHSTHTQLSSYQPRRFNIYRYILHSVPPRYLLPTWSIKAQSRPPVSAPDTPSSNSKHRRALESRDVSQDAWSPCWTYFGSLSWVGERREEVSVFWYSGQLFRVSAVTFFVTYRLKGFRVGAMQKQLNQLRRQANFELYGFNRQLCIHFQSYTDEFRMSLLHFN